MKQRSVGELQALRVASRFLMGMGMLAIIVSVFLLVLFLKLTPEEKHGDIHKNDPISGGIIMILATCSVVGGWKLRTFVKKSEVQTGQSAKPFGWVP
jgi:hypothetical protein